MSSTNHKGRYSVPTEEDFEPGSNQQVLKNYAGITSKTVIETLEAVKLAETELAIIGHPYFNQQHQFTAQDLCDIHEFWLGDVYAFAGKYRTVSMSKDGFPFASPAQVPQLIQNLETKYLKQYTPCNLDQPEQLAYALGIVHVEFILIHPFREGNGRIARLLADLMVMQAGRPSLDFTSIEQIAHEPGFKNYILAIHAGHDGNYKPIQAIFSSLIEK